MAKKTDKQISVGGNINPSGEPRTIIVTQPMRGGVDIATFMSGVKKAESVDYPSRVTLYDLYSDLLLTDGHLNAVINKRKAALLNTPIEFHRNGKMDEKIQEQIRAPWFFNLIGDLWDSILWGCTPVQFYREGEWLNYDLIPRKHVDPVRKMVLHRQTDIKGEPFDVYSDFLVIGKPNDLGLLAKVMPYAIYKRNDFADWAQYAEIFGQPIREGEYDGWDAEARERLLEDLYMAGKSQVFVHPVGSKITMHESTQKSASSELYKSLVECCNDEISKVILGNTLTTQASATGTQALGTVQKKAEESINKMDQQYILNILNYEVFDIFARLGMNVSGGEFVFRVPQNLNLTERINIDNQLRNSMGLPMDDDYLYATYGVRKPDNYDELKRQAKERKTHEPELNRQREREQSLDDEAKQLEKQEKKRERKMINRLQRFFAVALKGKGALDW